MDVRGKGQENDKRLHTTRDELSFCDVFVMAFSDTVAIARPHVRYRVMDKHNTNYN